METEVFLAIYRGLIVAGFIIAFTAWFGYTILAPWNKYAVGRIVWALLLAITLVLSTSVAFVIIGNFPYRREFAISTFALFDVVLCLVAYGIYVKQIKGYVKRRVGQLSAKAVNAIKEKKK